MKFNKTILAAALLSVAVVGCASKDHQAESAPAPAVVSSTTTDDTGSVSDSDMMEDEAVSSGTSVETQDGVSGDDAAAGSDEAWSEDVQSGTTHDARKHKKNKNALPGTGTIPSDNTSTPSDSGTTTEPMDDTDSMIDSEAGTSTSDGM